MRSGHRIDGLFVGASNHTKSDYIHELKLPDDASWGDIARAQTERYRVNQARHYGLSRNASFRRIMDAQERELLKLSRRYVQEP